MAEPSGRDAFFSGSTDKRGHHESVRSFAVTPGMHGLMGVIANRPEFPYKNFGDLCRDALHHRLNDLLEMLDDSVEVEKLRRTLEVERLLEQRLSTKAAYETQRRLVDETLDYVADSRYSSFDGVNVKQVVDAYRVITFQALAEDFERRLILLGISLDQLSAE